MSAVDCKRRGRFRWALPLLMAAGWLPSAPAAEARIDFAHQVAPLLRQHCAECHTGDRKKGGLSMNTRESLLTGGESGPAVTPGRSSESRLVRLTETADLADRMPPKGNGLTPEQILVLRRWIDQGAEWTAGFSFDKTAYEPPLKPRRPALPPAVPGRAHPVDRILDAHLAARQLPLPRPAEDSVFLRRAHLDLLGLLPTPKTLEDFARDQSPDKRESLVRNLLTNNVAYADHWLTFWNDLLRNDYAGTGYIDGGRKQITPWLYRALLEDKPYDQMTRELIAPGSESDGFARGIQWRGEVSAGQSVPVQFAQSVGQAFLGINLKCASCHDSFVDRWKLDEAFGLAAVYADQPLELYRCDKPLGRMAKPAWLFPELGQVDASQPKEVRLSQLAALMTHPENGRFTRTMVNRLWHRLMGRGVVHPTDAMQTEPWNADLLDYLACHLADHGYSLKKTIELICTSRAYQSRAQALSRDVDDQGYVYQGPRAKRLTAEQFVDALSQMTGVAASQPDAGVAKLRAAQATGKPIEIQARWIWSDAQRNGQFAAADETLALRKRFDLPAAPRRAGLVVACDNQFTLFVNGKKVLAHDDWTTPKGLSLEARLRQGANELLLVAANAGETPNPAGALLQAQITLDEGREIVIATDPSWEWTRQKPDAAGKLDEQAASWRFAEVVSDAAVWKSAQAGLAATLGQSLAGPQPMVRAALLKSDLLMRSLGRPNREQIVTMRPSELSTLEAMDLNNGQILATRLEEGARQLAGKSWKSPEALVDWLFAYALSRQPTPAELAATRQVLGQSLQPQGIEDLLWSVCMLPEFQLVR